MCSDALRILALLLAILIFLSLSGAGTTAAALLQAQPPAAESCCDHGAPEPDEPTSSCTFGDCTCYCCPAELLPGDLCLFGSSTSPIPFSVASEALFPAGYPVGIDYPPEPC